MRGMASVAPASGSPSLNERTGPPRLLALSHSVAPLPGDRQRAGQDRGPPPGRSDAGRVPLEPLVPRRSLLSGPAGLLLAARPARGPAHGGFPRHQPELLPRPG